MASCIAAPAVGVLCQGPGAAASRLQRSSWAPRAPPAAPHQQQWRQRRRQQAATASAAADDSTIGVIIECDGALVDAHVNGHMVAFNRAFSEIGHDCTNWTPAVFYDLMRLGDGTGEGVIAAYYGIRGWPMMLPSKDRGAFLQKVHSTKVRILREMTAKGEVPLRPGAAEFLDDALAAGARVAVVAATASVPDDALVTSAMYNLGPNRAFQLRVINMGGGGAAGAAGEGADGASASGSGGGGEEDAPPVLSFEQQVAEAQGKAKSQAAQEFVRAYNLQKASGMGLGVDPKMMTAAERAGRITPQFMAALAATLDVPCSSTIIVAGGHTIMEAGKSAGMLALGVPPGVASRGGFSAADAIFDGYGAGGGLTWAKANLILNKRREQGA